jgi:hypothetical protein
MGRIVRSRVSAAGESADPRAAISKSKDLVFIWFGDMSNEGGNFSEV